ncbi:MAG: hypothetical protein ACREJR_09950 [Candidatus Rokuibacteriota bacterium]
MRTSIALKVGVIAALLALALTSTASAAIPGYQRIVKILPAPNVSDSTQFLGRHCPRTKQSLGGGAEVTYGSPGGAPFGQIVLNRLVPGVFDAERDGVTVRGFEDQDGTPLNWGLTTQVICALPLDGDELLPFIRPANDSAPLGYKRIDDSDAHCSAGKKLVGFGAEITDGFGPSPDGEVIIDDLTPNSSLTGVSVTAFEDLDGTDAYWGIAAWIRCADPLPGLQLVASTTFHNSFWYKQAIATCPAGKKMLAAGGDLTRGSDQGGDISGGNGGALMDNIRLDGGLLGDDATVVARTAS